MVDRLTVEVHEWSFRIPLVSYSHTYRAFLHWLATKRI